MAWQTITPGSLWYNDATQQYAFSKPPEVAAEEASAMAKLPTWIREGWQIVSGDASGTGVSQTSVINPHTGKAETLIPVAHAPDANGIKQAIGEVPYREYLALKEKEPTLNIYRTLPSPENSMIDTGIGGQLMDALKAAGPVALGMALPGILSPAISSALGTSSLVSNALASGATSLLTGGDPLQSALGSLVTGGLGGENSLGSLNAGGSLETADQLAGLLPGGGLGSTAGGIDFSALDANPSGAITGTSALPYQVAGGNYGGNTTMTDVVPQVNDAVTVTPDWTNYAAGADQAQFGTAYDGNAAAPITTALPGVGVPTTIPTTTPTIPPAAVAAGAGAAAAAGLGGGGSTVTSGGDVDLTGVGTNPNPYNADPNAVNSASNSAIAKILAGTATAEDWAKLTGQALPGLLGAYASNQQTNALKSLADQYAAYGAPSRARYEASMSPGFDPTTIPGYKGALDTASDSLLRRLSASGGNPFGNPGGLIEANKAVVAGTALPAVQDYQRMNAGTGGLANLAAAYPATQNAATGANANIYNSLGVAAADIFNPRQSLNDLLKSMGTKTTLV